MNDTTIYAGGLAAVLYLITGGGEAFPESIEAARDNASDVAQEIRTWEPITEDGELGAALSGDQWVFYDDPEQGEHDDEAGDDTNVEFGDVGLDGSNYAPDVQDGSTAPEGGALADPGDSQTWGTAGEQENDDLTERTATSNLSDDEKSMFDRFANQDSTTSSSSDGSDSSTSTTSGGTTSSSTDDDLGGLTSGSSYSTIDDGSSSSDDDDDGGYTISLPDSLTQDESEDLAGDYSGGYVI